MAMQSALLLNGLPSCIADTEWMFSMYKILSYGIIQNILNGHNLNKI